MSLDSLLYSAIGHNNDDLKFVFVGGKGGVGKTTSSSAIATLLSQHCNRRVLLVSTDPAHSLSDAFRRDFTNEPTSPGMDNLHVMEVNPTETMQKELSKWTRLADEITGSVSEETGEEDGMTTKIKQFQEWLTGIPGIDEATALSSAIHHIESNEYDLIVFDTAPTGHTLKLLGMPDILQAGIEKLQGWQSTLWGYYDVVKGYGGSTESTNRLKAKEEVSQMLETYRRGIQKVALMLQDQRRTRFVVVCIAEYLSVSETQRLLRELKKNQVRSSHIIVNQLVVDDALSGDELEELESLAEIGSLSLKQELLSKTVHACRLTTARKAIQEKYLKQLQSFPETQDILDGICQVPLLAEEVTGNDALLRFAKYMVKDPPSGTCNASKTDGPLNLYDDELDNYKKGEKSETESWIPGKGDVVKVDGLAKSPQYNALEGVIVSAIDPETNRVGIRIQHEGQSKTLALQMKNVVLVHKAKKPKTGLKDKDPMMPASANDPPPPVGPGGQTMSKAMSLLEDPEIKSMIESNPRFKAAVEECLSNPMAVMKYLGDPELSPLISKAMSKLKF